MPKTHFVVLVDKKAVRKGKKLRKIVQETKKKHPRKKISIRYEYPEEILIAIIQL